MSNVIKNSTPSELYHNLLKEQEKYDLDIKLIEDTVNTQDRERIKLQKFELTKWQEFNKIVENEDYFSLDHVNKLNLSYDLLIFLSSKNSGKTQEQYRIIRETIKKGKKFFYLRTLRREVEGLALQFEQDKNSPVMLVKYKSWYLLYDRDQWNRIKNEEIKKDKLGLVPKPSRLLFDKYGVDFVGFCVDMHSSNLVGGQEFPGVELIIYDECLSHHSTVKTKFEHCEQFRKFISSVQRSKDKLRVLCFGNITQNLALLNYYGISVNDKLRYIPSIDPETRNISGFVLFINAGGLYGGSLRNQEGAVQIGDSRSTLELVRNEIARGNRNIVADTFFNSDNANKPPFNFLVNYAGNNYKIILRYLLEDANDPDSKKIYGVYCSEALDNELPTEPAITNTLFYSYAPNVKYSDLCLDYLEPLFDDLENKSIYFVDNDSFINFSQLYDDYSKNITNRVKLSYIN